MKAACPRHQRLIRINRFPMDDYWLFNTPDGWIVVISAVGAAITATLAWVTWQTAKVATATAEAAVRSASVAEADLRHRSTVVVIPKTLIKGSIPTRYLVTLQNVSEQPAFGFMFEVSYLAADEETQETWKAAGISNMWNQYWGVDEGLPDVLVGRATHEMMIAAPSDIVEASGSKAIDVRELILFISYSDSTGAYYESTTLVWPHSGGFHWSSLQRDGDYLWGE